MPRQRAQIDLKNFELRAAWEAEFVGFQFLEVDQKLIGYLGLQCGKKSRNVCIRVALCLHFTNALSYSTYNKNLELNPNSGFVNKEHNAPAK